MKWMVQSMLLIFLSSLHITKATWWLLKVGEYREQDGAGAEQYCSRMSAYMTRSQRRICLHSPSLMSVLARGARRAIVECEKQFRNERWNCPTYNKSSPRHHPFAPILKSRGREKAFVHSIFSASMAYEITRACTNGFLSSLCDCAKLKDRDPNQTEFVWRGCSDDIDFGIKIVRRFFDDDSKSKRRKRTLRRRIEMHNSKIGQQVLINNTRLVCKCHGLSGSCNQQICYHAMPPIHEVSHRLKALYSAAIEARKARRMMRARRGRGTATRWAASLWHDDDDASDDEKFCRADRARGSFGTRDRACNSTMGAGRGSCAHLCCGRGHASRLVSRKEPCKCKILYSVNDNHCCAVRCETCSRTYRQSRCL